jgi:hypothetical protein
MPRLNLSMSDNYSAGARTQPGGRRVRALSGVEVAEDSGFTRRVAPLLLKAGLMLALVASIAASPSILRQLHLFR